MVNRNDIYLPSMLNYLSLLSAGAFVREGGNDSQLSAPAAVATAIVFLTLLQSTPRQ